MWPCRLGAVGRVEDGRGSLGPVANTPFPIPARRTGRAISGIQLSDGFTARHTTCSQWQAFETQQAAFSEDKWYLSASSSRTSMQGFKTKVGNLLVPNNNDPWPEVRDT